VDRNGTIEFRKAQYTAKIGQIPIKINIAIPDSAFIDPMIQANLEITKEQFNNTIKELEFELTRLRED
jgi:hypothetical protein